MIKQNNCLTRKQGITVLRAVWLIILYSTLIGLFLNLTISIAFRAASFGNLSWLHSYTALISELSGKAIAIYLIHTYIVRNNLKKIDYHGNTSALIFISVISLVVGFRVFYHNTVSVNFKTVTAADFTGKITDTGIFGNISLIIIVLCVAPLFEEILFRGLILNGLAKRYGHGLAIFLSSVLFALMHFNMVQYLNAFVMGILLSVIYILSNSMTLCIIAHLANNLFALLAVFGYLELSEGFNLNHMLGSIVLILFCTAAYYTNSMELQLRDSEH